MLAGLRNRNLTARVRQPVDELWDRYLGVHTFGHYPGSGGPGDREWYLHYIPSSYRDVFAVLDRGGVGPDDIVTDLGCGLGRVVFAASYRGAARVEGVDLIPSLVDSAKANLASSRLKHRDIRFHARNALDHHLGDTTFLYLFHPFGPEILGEVMEKARDDRRSAGIRRPLRIAYVNPVGESVLNEAGWLRPDGDMPPRREHFSSALHYRTAFWESTDV
ncbi:MAG: class I SAM-dependent methyltransferase [Sphingopyxis sp.]|nr:class I SAM-dependent methyltransferase [Sphingopyxis sp.]